MAMSCNYILVSTALFVFLRMHLSGAQLNDPAVFYTTVELICSDGYPVQEHKILTEDGYILTAHRIPTGKRRGKVPRRSKQFQRIHTSYHSDFAPCVNQSLGERPTGPPVLLSHGLFAASDNFVLQGPGSDLAYLLADSGYDVWFTNIRGNFYSRRHVSLKPSQSKFWDFSFHEMGVYDIPATIDYILEITGYRKLTYIGHSMGTTMLFVMLSTKPEYNEKINLFVGLTPVSEIKEKNFSKERNAAFSVGYKFVKKLTVFLAHTLGGTSTKAIDHYAQFFDSPFAQFDYGVEENHRRYKQATPPLYDYNKTMVPTALFYSTGDYIVDAKDTQIILDNLPNLVEVGRFSKYSHVDFIWAYNAKDLVYPRILSLVEKYKDK